MRRRFATLDVFTNTRFAGNPLAVVLDGENLDDAAMQAIAREFNLSETVFVRPAENSEHRARIRIFTPAQELPFAGHPTVGTAVLLGQIDTIDRTSDIVLEENVGPVRCSVTPSQSGVGSAQFGIPKLPEYQETTVSPADLAEALGIEPADIGCDSYAPGRWSSGVGFTMVPVRGLDAIKRARPNISAWENAFGTSGHYRAAFLFCRETSDRGNAFHARMFAPTMGIPEDPATGSAVANLAGMIARYAGLEDGDHAFGIEQGYEMGRASVLRLRLTIRGGALAAAAIGGDAVLVSEGTIEA